MSGRATQVYAEVYVKQTADTFITEVYSSDMGRSSGYRRKVTGVYANVMGEYPLNTGEPAAEGANRFSQVWANVMIPFTPNFEWIEMFIPEVFPYDISFNSIGATRFMTDVAIVDSGHDQRSSRWTQPLMEYDVAYGVRTLEDLHGLIAFFRAMKGRKHAFLYRDHMDYSSTLATKEESRRAPPVTFGDQKIGVANHKQHQFQLVKTYKTPGGTVEAQVRPIYKPQSGSVKIGVDAQEVFNFTVDYTNGLVTFVSDLVKTGLNNMSIALHPSIAGRWRISGPNGWTTGFVTGDKVITTGWLNTINSNSLTLDLVVNSVSATYIDVTPSNANYGEAESNRNGVTVQRHPAPITGDVTAGFLFYVPVRFDTDRLPTSLEHYGIGGAADVKLVEVRPTEENL